MCGYFCIGFINFMFNSNSLTDFTNLFSPNNFKENDDIILNYFLTNLKSLDSIQWNSVETSNLDNQQFRLNRVNEIKFYC